MLLRHAMQLKPELAGQYGSRALSVACGVRVLLLGQLAADWCSLASWERRPRREFGAWRLVQGALVFAASQQASNRLLEASAGTHLPLLRALHPCCRRERHSTLIRQSIPQPHFCLTFTHAHTHDAGFPTLKFFGENKERPEDYNGGRDTGSLASFATQRWSAQQPPPEVSTKPWCGLGWGGRRLELSICARPAATFRGMCNWLSLPAQPRGCRLANPGQVGGRCDVRLGWPSAGLTVGWSLLPRWFGRSLARRYGRSTLSRVPAAWGSARPRPC